MPASATNSLQPLLRWCDVYSEPDLYKAALRIYTKPLFQWRKALTTSTDGKTLYDFAAHGLARLDTMHLSLQRGVFQFRPAVALRYNFNGKHRTLFLPPWEERVVDLLLYRALNRKLHSRFSPNSYAYRDRRYSLDTCQTRIAALTRSAAGPLYLVKRDISDFFASIDHQLLLHRLAGLIDPADYLFTLLRQRVNFSYQQDGLSLTAKIGVPFGTSIACLLANIYLTDLDHEIAKLPEVHFFRYADDMLLLSPSRDAAIQAAEFLDLSLHALRLKSKPSHQSNLLLSKELSSAKSCFDTRFTCVNSFRHLGLLFRVGGVVALSRDKTRKIQNLFRFTFRRKRRRWKSEANPHARARLLAAIAAETVEKSIRNVAVLDYYLKHVNDQQQLYLLDRWLAEEVLSAVFGGHKKAHFRRITFQQLRDMGLPSLLHRRRLLCSGKLESPFFVWQREKASRAFQGTVARLCRSAVRATFSSFPEAAAAKRP
jgi:hypothetical protein